MNKHLNTQHMIPGKEVVSLWKKVNYILDINEFEEKSCDVNFVI